LVFIEDINAKVFNGGDLHPDHNLRGLQKHLVRLVSAMAIDDE
jgi:hypothetical protein